MAIILVIATLLLFAIFTVVGVLFAFAVWHSSQGVAVKAPGSVHP